MPSIAKGNQPCGAVSAKAAHASLLAKPYTLKQKWSLGNVVGLASTDARRDHAVLDFLVTFFIKKKGKNNHLLSASTPTTLLEVYSIHN